MGIISLTDDEKQKLIALSQYAPELLIHRARLILAYADGKPTMQASKEAGISRGRARFWKRQYLSKGMRIFELDSSNRQEQQDSIYLRDVIAEEQRSRTTASIIDASQPGIQEDIPFPKRRQSIRVNPDDTLGEAGKKVWLYYFAEMLSHEEGTLRGGNIEELHDMRVATRRMRTAFDVFSPAYDPKLMKHYLKGLRIVGSMLGEVRDMDVILEKALCYQDELSEDVRTDLEPLITEWKRTIDKHRAKMVKHLQSQEYHHFKYDFNLFLQSPESNTDQASVDETYTRIRDIVPVLVYSRYAAVRTYESILPTATLIQLHALRIEFKKFRYTLEYFREILGQVVNQAIDELKRLQDHLGELHDADVACALVRGFIKKWDINQSEKPIRERLNPEPIVSYLAYLHAERYRLMSAFPALWKNFSRPEFRQIIAQAISLL